MGWRKEKHYQANPGIEVILVSDYYSMEFGKGKGNDNVLNKESWLQNISSQKFEIEF